MHNSLTLVIFNLNQDYIAKNLCILKDIENNTCRGCCHLKKQLEEQNEQEKNAKQSKQRLVIDLFELSLFTYQPIPPSKQLIFLYKSEQLLTPIKMGIFHPPKSLM